MVNAPAGEHARFTSTSEGPVLELVLDLSAAHHGPPPHVHRSAEETFQVLEGAVELLTGRAWRPLAVGEQVTVPRRTRHTYRGVPGQSSRTLVRVSPGAPMRAFLTDLYALAEQGRVDAEGSPRLRDAARLFRTHPDAMQVSGVPAWLAPSLWWLLSGGRS